MKVIIKPAGLIVLVAAMVLLAALAFRGRGGEAVSVVSSGASSAPAASPATGGVTSAVTPIGANSSTTPVHMSEQALINPDASAQVWEFLCPKGDVEWHDYPCSLPGFSQFRRVLLVRPAKNPWDVQIRQLIEHPIALGAHLHVRVWARSKDDCPFTVVCEQEADPYAKLMTRGLNTTPNWQQFDVDWTSDRDVKPGWAVLDLQLGAKAGQIDIACVSMVSSTATS